MRAHSIVSGRCRIILALLLFAIIAPSAARADVKLPSIFGDHMVIQQQAKVPIWGWAEPGEEITVTVKITSRDGKESQVHVPPTKADADGRWRVELSPMLADKDAKPIEITVAGKNTITLRDVLVGEVWLCSGQSNMEWTVARSGNAREEIAAGDHPKIRHIKVPRQPSGSVKDDFKAQWQVCSPQTVANFTACGYYMARELQKELGVPIGLINSSWGGTRIEPWTPPVGFDGVPALSDIAKSVHANAGKKPRNHQQPAALYNGMIHPLVGFPFRGAIWYQGESNHREGMMYFEKKKALVQGWRKLWDNDFPFYFVQIAPFQYGKEDPAVLATFWEAQAKCLDIPKTGMVVTSDIATLNDIHPPNKQDVGKRLALLALNRTYGKDVVDSGPMFKEAVVENDQMRITFHHAEGLKTRDGKSPTHFEIAGAKTGFVPADAEIQGKSVVIKSAKVTKPVAMRFAWHKLAEPNLVNGAGLPTAAFRHGEIPKPDFLGEIDDAKGYTLVYDIDLANLSANPRYDVNHSDKTGAFDRIAYLLELQSNGNAQYVWVAMDAFTDDASKIAIPTASSGANFQQSVAKMTVVSNAGGIKTGSGITGNIEFWPNNYGTHNSANVAGADSKIYDIGDQPVGPADGYGSMQVHHTAAKQTVFAINQWKAGGGGANIGIGNSEGKTRDWTFIGNGSGYTAKRLRVFVRTK